MMTIECMEMNQVLATMALHRECELEATESKQSQDVLLARVENLTLLCMHTMSYTPA